MICASKPKFSKWFFNGQNFSRIDIVSRTSAQLMIKGAVKFCSWWPLNVGEGGRKSILFVFPSYKLEWAALSFVMWEATISSIGTSTKLIYVDLIKLLLTLSSFYHFVTMMPDVSKSREVDTIFCNGVLVLYVVGWRGDECDNYIDNVICTSCSGQDFGFGNSLN